MSNPYETVSQIMAERDQLRAELAALKAGQGEAVVFEGHWPTIAAELPEHHRSNYCAGDVYSAERDAALAGWTAHAEICQVPPAPPAPADAVSVPRELLERICGATQQSVVPDLATLRTLYVQRMKATDELRALLAQSQEVKS